MRQVKATSHLLRYICVPILGAMFAFCTGCGPKMPERVKVSGQVLIDGKPLSHGFVFFVPTGGRPSRAPLDSEGRFVLSSFGEKDGAAIGTHRVGVLAREEVGAKTIKWHAPKKYGDYTTSGIEKQITGSTDNLLIELTWAGDQPFTEVDMSAGSSARESQQQ
jgi:hypothetical protein